MPGRDLTADRLAVRNLARQPACCHGAAVPVDLSTGERVAWLCPECDAQFGAGWSPPRCADCAEQLGHPYAVAGGLRVCLSCARKITAYGGTVKVPREVREEEGP